MNEENKKNWVDVFVSPRISTTQGVGVNLFKDKINELVNTSEEVNPEGRIVITIFHKIERFRPLANAIGNLSFAERYYPNAIAFGNAEVTKEWSDILDHLNAINKIIGKRKKAFYQKRNSEKQSLKEITEDKNN